MDHGILCVVVSMGFVVQAVLLFLVVSEENRRAKRQAKKA